jgi:hypothetical protein
MSWSCHRQSGPEEAGLPAGGGLLGLGMTDEGGARRPASVRRLPNPAATRMFVDPVGVTLAPAEWVAACEKVAARPRPQPGAAAAYRRGRRLI